MIMQMLARQHFNVGKINKQNNFLFLGSNLLLENFKYHIIEHYNFVIVHHIKVCSDLYGYWKQVSTYNKRLSDGDNLWGWVLFLSNRFYQTIFVRQWIIVFKCYKFDKKIITFGWDLFIYS